MKKRIAALFLLVCMLLTMLPVGALADDDSAAGGDNGIDDEPHTHAWGAWTDAGDQHTRKCTGCDATETAAHNWSDLKDLGNGQHGRTCADCGATKDVAEHRWWNEIRDLKNGTHGDKCFYCEATTNAEPHSWSAWERTGNGQHFHRCTKCTAVEIENHTWNAWVDKGDTHERTCMGCDAVDYGPHGNFTYTSNEDGTHMRICGTCGKTWESACSIRGATCAEPATCEECGQTFGEVSATHTGHPIYRDNKNGTHIQVCDTCGNPWPDAQDEPHKEVLRPVAGTKTHERYCETCGVVIKTENCTPKYVSNKDGTRNIGTHNVVCKDCGQTLEENVPCTPDKTNVKCGTDVKCTVCSGSYKLPHDLDENKACKRFSTDSKKNKCSCTESSHQEQWKKDNAMQDSMVCQKCGNTIEKQELDVSFNVSGYKENNAISSLSVSSNNANVKPTKPIDVTPNDPKKFQKGQKYTVTVPFTVEPGYKIKSLKIGGVAATPMQLDDGSWVATAELPAVEEMVTLTFKTNGGKTMNPIDVPKGTKITSKELQSKYKPTRKGYWFSGWYKESTLKNKVGDLTLNEDTTIYAKWKKEDTTNPKTGDNSGWAMGILTLTTVLGAAAVVTKKKRVW